MLRLRPDQLLLACLAACSAEVERPGHLVEACQEPNGCAAPASVARHDSNQDRDASAPVTLSARLWLLGNPDFVRQTDAPQNARFEGGAVVTGPGAQGETVKVMVGPGSDTFVLPELASAPEAWFTVRPLDSDQRALPTLQAVDTTLPGEVDLYLISSWLLDETIAALPDLLVRDPEAAQVVLRFGDGSETERVTVGCSVAWSIAYRVPGGSWSREPLLGTGLVLLANLLVPDSGQVTVNYSFEQTEKELALPVATGSVTLFDLVSAD